MSSECEYGCGGVCRARIALVWTDELDQTPSVITDLIKTTCIDAELDQLEVLDFFCGYPHVSVQVDVWNGPIEAVPLPQWESIQAWEIGGIIPPDVTDWVLTYHQLHQSRLRKTEYRGDRDA